MPPFLVAVIAFVIATILLMAGVVALGALVGPVELSLIPLISLAVAVVAARRTRRSQR
ncbi:hypothetical protein [Bailinhaonella thermotolerans]|uniref:hypothetical protein n=1 Tax=Bailinhaonella thermotolerans TaxID=1070861 RepID=UPI00192A5DC8|nr:hypothetical protein [Bailinhaonella thermotolerans]